MNQKPGVWVQELQASRARLLPGSEGAQFVLWSPDSKSVAFRVLGQLYRFDLASSAPVAIAPMPIGPTFGADWGDDGTGTETILFRGAGLMRVSGSGGIPVTMGVAGAAFPRLLPDGRFFATSNQTATVFGAPLNHPDQRVEVLKENVAPVYAPQEGGKAKGGSGHLLWIRGTTLLAQEFDPGTLRLAGKPTVIADPAWTVAVSSGVLLYDPAPTMTQSAWVDRAARFCRRLAIQGLLPATLDGKPAGDSRPYIAKPEAQAWAHFSPDGGWVAYESASETEHSEIFVDRFPVPQGAVRISTNGGFGPRWNPKGGELFYRSPDSKLMAVSMRLDKNSAVPSTPRELFTMPVSARANIGSQYDVHPDGKRFLIQVPVKKAPLNVIVNWRALLKDKAAGKN